MSGAITTVNRAFTAKSLLLPKKVFFLRPAASAATQLRDCHNGRGRTHQSHSTDQTTTGGSLVVAAAAAAGMALASFTAFSRRKPVHAKSAPNNFENHRAGKNVENLPIYSMDEVGIHDHQDKRIWVTYKRGVYDITDFLARHPGSKNILMAAGGSVEPFWEIYAVHKNNMQVLNMLEEYRIGNLREEDAVANAAGAPPPDPFANEPERSPNLSVLSSKPCNAETPLSMLAEKFLTPNELFYVRSHLPTPQINDEEYELEIGGIGLSDDVILSLQDLKKFPQHTVTAAIQCGGNRRSEMNDIKPLKGLNWKGGAIGNAQWTGVRLYDVLKHIGVQTDDESIKHVHFEGYDVGADGSPYAASIAVGKALDPRGDVLLAFEMNGETIPRDHGYPIRVVVPGVVGARNVKWLNRIVLSEKESDSHWQQNDYKGFSPSKDWDNVDFSQSPAIQSMPVTSSICEPAPNTKVKAGDKVKVKGYAWSGGGNRVIRVDLTTDGGKSWIDTKLLEQDSAQEPRHYGWTLWEAMIEVPERTGELEIWSKAVDSNYNVQPETFENIWNLRGLLSNAYCRVKMTIS